MVKKIAATVTAGALGVAAGLGSHGWYLPEPATVSFVGLGLVELTGLVTRRK